MSLRSKSSLGIPGAIMMITLFFGCAGPEAPAETTVRPIKTLKIGGVTNASSREFPGEIRASEQSNVSFEVGGRVLELLVKSGERVAKGKVLARLDPRDFQTAVEREQAKVRANKTEFDRQSTLFKKGVVPESEIDRARRNLEVSEANAKSTTKALQDATLTAPFSGVVARIDVDQFENVQAKQTILLLQNPKGLEIAVDIPEADVVRTRHGLTKEERTERVRPRIRLSSAPEREIPAHLAEMATAADPVSRTYEAILTFDPPKDLSILPGMTATLVIDIPEDVLTEIGVSIPASAVTSDEQGQPFVWRLDPETMTVHRAAVALGELAGSLTTISAGLEPGDEVAISGMASLREGMLVARMEE